MRVLITGGAGFLGIYLARFLLRKKYQITILDRVDIEDPNVRKRVNFVKGDIRDKGIVSKAIVGADFVIHAAAALPIQQSAELIYSVNVDGTRNVLEMAWKQKVKRLIYISTTAVYKIYQPHPVDENGIVVPMGHYGGSKVAAESLCREYMEKGLSIIIVRPKTFLGPERLGVFEILYEWIYEGRRVPILGNGENLYQLLDVNELCDALDKMLTTKNDNEVYNIGAAKFGTVADDLNYVINQAKTGARLFRIPAKPVQIILGVLERLQLSPLAEWHYKTANLDSYVDISKAQKLLGWKSVVSGKEVLWEAYEWFVKHRKEVIGRVGVTHRVGWNEKMLGWVRKLM